MMVSMLWPSPSANEDCQHFFMLRRRTGLKDALPLLQRDLRIAAVARQGSCGQPTGT